MGPSLHAPMNRIIKEGDKRYLHDGSRMAASAQKPEGDMEKMIVGDEEGAIYGFDSREIDYDKW